jgi:hypothetical protein
MTKKAIELDVDIIGDQKGLTVDEQKLLSDYFGKRKRVLKKSPKAKGAQKAKATH